MGIPFPKNCTCIPPKYASILISRFPKWGGVLSLVAASIWTVCLCGWTSVTCTTLSFCDHHCKSLWPQNHSEKSWGLTIKLAAFWPVLRRFRDSCIYSSSRFYSSHRSPPAPERSMNWSASVLSTVSSDTEPTILLTFDSAKYIFNAGENTNRAFLQSRDSWKRTRGMFFTDIGTQRTGGIAGRSTSNPLTSTFLMTTYSGLLMSFADATISKLDLVGPPGLVHLLASMRLYTYRYVVHSPFTTTHCLQPPCIRDTMPIQPTEASWTPSASPPDPIYKDENITVYGVPVLPTLTEESRFSASTPDLAYASITEASLKRKRDPSPDHPVKRSSATSGSFGGPSLQDLMRHSDFSPEVLVGESGQDWRRLLISTMFPGSKGHKNGKAEAKKGKEGKGKGKGRKEEFVSSNPDHGGQNLEPSECGQRRRAGFVNILLQ